MGDGLLSGSSRQVHEERVSVRACGRAVVVVVVVVVVVRSSSPAARSGYNA